MIAGREDLGEAGQHLQQDLSAAVDAACVTREIATTNQNGDEQRPPLGRAPRSATSGTRSLRVEWLVDLPPLSCDGDTGLVEF